jgi:hypothetical protein
MLLKTHKQCYLLKYSPSKHCYLGEYSEIGCIGCLSYIPTFPDKTEIWEGFYLEPSLEENEDGIENQ